MRRIYSIKYKGVLCIVLMLTLLMSATPGVARADESSDVTTPGNLTAEESSVVVTEEPDTAENISAIQEEPDITEESVATEVPSESEEPVPGDEAVSVRYDSQPTTVEEVQTAIDEYNEAYQAVLAANGFLAALEVAKPHWEFEVAASIMPSGYNCQLVDWDEDFGADYYTFFPSPVTLAFSGGTGSSADPYIIGTEQDLKDLATAVNGGTTYSDSVFELQNNIALSSSFAGIGYANDGYITTSRAFRGTFDGKVMQMTKK